MSVTLTTDVKASLAALDAPAKGRGSARMSWSRYSDLNNCYAMYFLKSFNVSIRPTQALGNDHYSFDGKFIQKIIEVFYRNSSVSHRFNELSKTEGELEKFIKTIVDALDHCIVLTPHEAKIMGIQNLYDWAKSPDCTHYLEAKLKEITNDPYVREFIMTRPQMCIVDREGIELERGGKSYKSLLKEIVKASSAAVHFFNRYFQFQRTGTELWTTYTIQGVEFCGMTDMVVNPNDGTKPKYMNHLQNGYFMIDGKRKVNSYQNHDQLKYYSVLVDLAQGVKPYSLTLFDYTEAKGHPLPYDRSYIQTIMETLGKYQQIIPLLRNNLLDSGLEVRKPWELLPRSPSENACRYCPAGQDPENHCELSKATRLADRIAHAKAAREAETLINEQLSIGESGYSNLGELSI